MQKHFIPVHFVSNPVNFEEFIQGLQRYDGMREIFKRKTNDFNFGLKLTTSDKTLDPILREKVRDITRKLPSDLFLLYDPVDKGPGTSVRQVFYNPTFSNGIVLGTCLDQQVIDSDEAVERVIDLTNKIEKDNSLYGVGSRTVPVVLATNQRNSELRIIHELFLASAMGIKGPEEQISGTTPAYSEIGDCSTGMDILNLSHPGYPDLVKGITSAVQIADMNGFASCYYAPLKSAQMGCNLTKGFACSRTNPFSNPKPEREECGAVTEMIQYQTQQLCRTDLGDFLCNAIKNPTTANKISEFYSRSEVELVKELMLGDK